MQDALAGLMANPYVLAAAFILTLFGAWSGIRSFLQFLRSAGDKSFEYAFKKYSHRPLEDGVRMAARADGDLGYLVGQYVEIVFNFVFQVSIMILQVIVALHFIEKIGQTIDVYFLLSFAMILFAISSFFRLITLRIKLFALKNAGPLIKSTSEKGEVK